MHHPHNTRSKSTGRRCQWQDCYESVPPGKDYCAMHPIAVRLPQVNPSAPTNQPLGQTSQDRDPRGRSSSRPPSSRRSSSRPSSSHRSSSRPISEWRSRALTPRPTGHHVSPSMVQTDDIHTGGLTRNDSMSPSSYYSSRAPSPALSSNMSNMSISGRSLSSGGSGRAFRTGAVASDLPDPSLALRDLIESRAHVTNTGFSLDPSALSAARSSGVGAQQSQVSEEKPPQTMAGQQPQSQAFPRQPPPPPPPVYGGQQPQSQAYAGPQSQFYGGPPPQTYRGPPQTGDAPPYNPAMGTSKPTGAEPVQPWLAQKSIPATTSIPYKASYGTKKKHASEQQPFAAVASASPNDECSKPGCHKKADTGCGDMCERHWYKFLESQGIPRP